MCMSNKNAEKSQIIHSQHKQLSFLLRERNCSGWDRNPQHSAV